MSGAQHAFFVVLYCSVAPWVVGQLSSPECSQLLRRASSSQEHAAFPHFGLAARCARSQRAQLAMLDDVTQRQCERLAARKEALAFSYSRAGRQCVLTACPETGARASLVADRHFLYYSRYSGRAPGESWECVEGEGVFRLQLTPPRNLSEASHACARRGARLAHVASPRRSQGLASLLPPGRRALVGLRAVQQSNSSERLTFQAVTGVPLSCYLYRAWAPRHPRASSADAGCVTLDSSGRWRTTRCDRRHAFLCELLPTGSNATHPDAVKADLTGGRTSSEDMTVLDYCNKNDSVNRKKQPDLWTRE